MLRSAYLLGCGWGSSPPAQRTLFPISMPAAWLLVPHTKARGEERTCPSGHTGLLSCCPALCCAALPATGVVLRGGDALPADLVIDASGRHSQLPVWLGEAGWARPQAQKVDAQLC